MSSSSTTSRPPNRRPVVGVPTRCWCGNRIKTFASQTKDNPFRRFYRCVLASQRETEDHLFKWEDEAILDEIRMVDASRIDLSRDVETLSKNVMYHIPVLESRLLAIENKLQQTMVNREDTKVTTTSPINQTSPIHNVAVAIAVLGAAAWFYFKLS